MNRTAEDIRRDLARDFAVAMIQSRQILDSDIIAKASVTIADKVIAQLEATEPKEEMIPYRDAHDAICQTTGCGDFADVIAWRVSDGGHEFLCKRCHNKAVKGSPAYFSHHKDL